MAAFWDRVVILINPSPYFSDFPPVIMVFAHNIQTTAIIEIELCLLLSEQL